MRATQSSKNINQQPGRVNPQRNIKKKKIIPKKIDVIHTCHMEGIHVKGILNHNDDICPKMKSFLKFDDILVLNRL